MVLNGKGMKRASNNKSNFMVLDRRSNLGMWSDNFSFSSLVADLYKEDALTELEKCVVLLQMLTYVGDDLYEKYNQNIRVSEREESEKFLIDNSDFIDY